MAYAYPFEGTDEQTKLVVWSTIEQDGKKYDT